MIRSRKFSLPPFARSLSARLLVLTIAFVMLAEILIYAPSIANFRHNWLKDQADSAHLAILALEAAPEELVSEDLKAQLLSRVGAYAVVLKRPDRRLLLYTAPPPPVDVTVNLRDWSLLGDIGETFATMLRSGDPTMRLISPAEPDADLDVEVMFNEARLRTDMIAHSRNILLLSIAISLITGTLLYFALQWLMVRPMRRMTEDITRFSRDPKDLSRGVDETSRSDEIGVAQSVLAEMQRDLRSALRQQEHLAALGSAVSKINHDLRGILSTAVLLSDRLSGVDNPEVKRVAAPLIQAIDRAIALCTQTLTYARDEGPELSRSRFRLSGLVDEVAAELAVLEADADTAPCSGPKVENRIADDVIVEADRDQVYRVFSNLGRNAFEAGARRVTVEAVETLDPGMHIDVMDDGPGLATAAREGLFKPFKGSARKGGTGLGLVIARDVMQAHGGDLALVRSGDDGTVFRLTFAEVD
ncbi:MAG: HAMP domain-containing histidine kinase [Alphaproteobacteria bacterium]|nr:HAMP domain-containing histidine kinase [Alphaproteobacteria bacterium]